MNGIKKCLEGDVEWSGDPSRSSIDVTSSSPIANTTKRPKHINKKVSMFNEKERLPSTDSLYKDDTEMLKCVADTQLKLAAKRTSQVHRFFTILTVIRTSR